MGSRAVHNKYKDTVRSFKFPRSEYSSTFASRLAGLWNIFARNSSWSRDDKQTLAIYICDNPPPTHNSQGEPHWNGYKVQRLLDDDIDTGKHLRRNPKELHETRDEYRLFKPTAFWCNIEQLIRTAKYNYTLKVKTYSKLKKTMVKYDIGDVDVDEL